MRTKSEFHKFAGSFASPHLWCSRNTSRSFMQGRGFILPFILVLVSMLLTLGSWYMYSSVNSKNVFQIFYKDDLARLLAESAVNEWRATWRKRTQTDASLRALVQSPSTGNPSLALKLSDLPLTSAMATRLVGNGKYGIIGRVSIRNVDKDLRIGPGGTKIGAAKGEYQGTLRLSLDVSLGSAGARRTSAFIY